METSRSLWKGSKSLWSIKKHKISLILRCNQDSILLVADKFRLNQVILNIINNAIKIIKEGEIVVFLEKQDNYNTVLIRIKDDGPGIPSNIKDKLFTKFVTGSKSGTGLGLYICKNIIEKHGGKIWANNNVDNDGRETQGSTFTFTLPIKIT